MDNLHIYNHVRKPPETALKKITGGRLNGKTDINPMWRLKALTEQFGPCGVGWKYTITDKQLEHYESGEVAAFVDIDLFVKIDGQWSDAIPGTGGSMFAAKEKNGIYVSDECYKMALTDAISVSCKALGFAADVYWDSDKTKYDQRQKDEPQGELGESKIDATKVQTVKAMIQKANADEAKLLEYFKVDKIENMTISVFALVMAELGKRVKKQEQGNG